MPFKWKLLSNKANFANLDILFANFIHSFQSMEPMDG